MLKTLRTLFLILPVIVIFTSCKKEFSYEGGLSSSNSGTWQFQNNSKQYVGNMESAAISSVGGTKILTLAGVSLLDGQQNFQIRLYTTDSFTATTYLASLSQTDFSYFTSSKTIFTGDVLAGEFTVTVTSLANNLITGVFSGVAQDSTGAQTPITLGVFTSRIDLSTNGSGTPGGGTASVGTLGANPDTCTSVLLSGTYTTGIPFTTTNTAQVQVNVTTPGTFIIATNTVNGVNFFKTGTFTNTGVQTVLLDGSGTPQSAGAQTFTVTYGVSNCIFQVIFQPGTVPTGDYLPTTISSNWAYGREGGTVNDSISAQVISYTPTFGGNVYATLTTENIPPTGTVDSAFYRKSAGDYFNYINVSSIFQFDSPVYGEYVILNDADAAGTVIVSPDFSGTISGVPATGHIEATINEKAVPVTIGPLSFSDVIKVTYQYFSSSAPGVPFATEERWYARGVGLIYENLDGLVIYNIGRYTVQ